MYKCPVPHKLPPKNLQCTWLTLCRRRQSIAMAKSRPKVDNKPLTTPCIYCRKFQSSPVRLGNGTLRLCEFTNRQQTNGTKPTECDGFDIYPYIWCDVRHARYYHEVCASCHGCQTGDFVRKWLALHPTPKYAATPSPATPPIRRPVRQLLPINLQLPITQPVVVKRKRELLVVRTPRQAT